MNMLKGVSYQKAMHKDHTLARKTSGTLVRRRKDGFATGKEAPSPLKTVSRAAQSQCTGPFDWSHLRDIITQLYIIDDHPLKEVQRIMREQFSFHATQKMYKNQFRRWGLRKNLSSQFIHDFLVRTGQQHSLVPSQSLYVTIRTPNLIRPITSSIWPCPGSNRPWPGSNINIKLLFQPKSMSLPYYLKPPGDLGHVERSMNLIGDYIALSSKGSITNFNPWGTSYQKTADQAMTWMTMLSIGQHYIMDRRFGEGFAMLDHCFIRVRQMLEPTAWLIFIVFYAVSTLAKLDSNVAGIFLRYLNNVANIPTPHAFHHLFDIMKKCGADGVASMFPTVIGSFFMDALSQGFPDMESGLTVMQDLVQGKARSLYVYSMPAPRATVQRALDSIATKDGAVSISASPVSGRLSTKHNIVLRLPKSPTIIYDIVRCALPSPLLIDPGAEDNDMDIPNLNLGGNGTYMEYVIRDSLVEMYSDELRVTARLADLAMCFDETAAVSEVEEVNQAYLGLKEYLQNCSIYTEEISRHEEEPYVAIIEENSDMDSVEEELGMGQQGQAASVDTSIYVDGQLEPAIWHLHQDKCLQDVDVDVARFLLLLPEQLRHDLRLDKVLGNTCWTCIPPDSTIPYPIPLTIANIPVIIPVKTYYPLNAGLMPPPDPHPRHISSVRELRLNTVVQILDTFQEAIGFYLLINGMLQIIVPDGFDISSALNHYPGRFGGLQVSYVPQGQIPTAGEGNKRMKTSSTQWTHVASQTHNDIELSSTTTASGSGFGSLIPNPSRPTAEQGAPGKAWTNDQRPNSDLDWMWPQSGFEDVRLIAGNSNVELGTVAKTFDTDAGAFPDGFEHDISLVDVSWLPAAMMSGMSSDLPLEWLSEQEWRNLQFNTRNMFLLDDKDRSAKSIGIRPSQSQLVGQGVFRNRQKLKRWSVRDAFGRGKNKQDTESEMEACTDLVARSVLYRVAPDYDAPGGQSGTPVCLLDDSEPEMQKGKVVGLTSYVQMVQDIQHYHVEGDQLTKMLQDGRVAFYGAFKVPQEMKEEHVII
ncbi:hypothetical protein PG988_011107 [Apiospora saccharicola]